MNKKACGHRVGRILFTVSALWGVSTFSWGDSASSVNRVNQPAVGQRGMVSSAHPIATEAGLDVLAKGGNAFDAAVAVASTLNVVEPQNSGIGGYGLILVYDAKQKRVRALNSSGRIPASTNSDVFREGDANYKENRRGAKAISTPTNLNAWWKLSKGHGRLPWAELFESAIDAAEEGHAVSRSVARAIGRGFKDFPESAKTFYGQGGEPLKEGEVLTQKALGATLRRVANEGPKVLYGGPLGRAVHDTVQAAGGFVTMDDLLKNEAEWFSPIRVDYRGYEVYGCPAPANSFSSLVRLGIMERFDLEKLGHNSPAYLHRFAEATKHAYWLRLKYAGDPDIAPPPLQRLLSDAYFDEQAAKIDTARATVFEPPGVSGSTDAHTTHFVVADAEGNIVCATQTLGGGFGSRIMVDQWGVWLNNSLYFCTFEPKGNPMDAHAGRRKLISNHPTIVFREGKPWIAIGTPGGHTIGQTVAQMVMNLLDFDMNVQEAITAPRVSFVEPNRLSVEEAVSAVVSDALKNMGHNVSSTRGIGNAHGLTIEYGPDGAPNRFTGGADSRGSGQAKGL
jgi:gamma-glutamyltranspeptidase/glutathione hydrolase